MSLCEEKRLSLYIEPVTGRERVIEELYQDHRTAYAGDSGFDLFCIEDAIIPGKAISVAVPLGICVEAFYKHYHSTRDEFNDDEWKVKCQIPSALYIYPRSSMGSKSPLRLSNSVGVIDSGYRGELTMFVDNISEEPFKIEKGERYVQVCGPDLEPINYEIVGALSKTSRGRKGFGSSGR